MSNIYDKLDVVRCAGVFTNAAGTAIDPTSVFFSAITPSGTLSYTYGVNAQLVKDSTGNYHVDIDADTVGTYLWKFYSSGTGKAGSFGQFEVQPSGI